MTKTGKNNDPMSFVADGQSAAEAVAAALLQSGAAKSSHEIGNVTVVATVHTTLDE